MSTSDTEICGFLDVKSMGSRYVAQKVRKRALPLLKVWKRSWCLMKQLGEGPSFSLQMQFNQKLGRRDKQNALKQNEKDSCVIIPPNAVVHRIRSKTKQFAFGVSLTMDRKPLSLSANSETETQRWMADIRYLLKPRRHCTEKSYNMSMVDNAHSKAAGLNGLYGDLIANNVGIFIRNVHTGEIVETFEWKEFIQFHLMTAGRPEDVKRICVMHTSNKFRCGVGELYIFCLDANKLLQDLVTQGRGPRHRQKFMPPNNDIETVTHTAFGSLSSQLKSNGSFSILGTDINCLRTPTDLPAVENIYRLKPNLMYSEKLDSYNHRESNTSIASGIYEEIKDNICSSEPKTSLPNKVSYNLQVEPPALPPRQKQKPEYAKEDGMEHYSHPEISDHFEARQNLVCMQKTTFTDHSSYIPMSPQLRDFSTLESDVSENLKENDYVIMR